MIFSSCEKENSALVASKNEISLRSGGSPLGCDNLIVNGDFSDNTYVNFEDCPGAFGDGTVANWTDAFGTADLKNTIHCTLSDEECTVNNYFAQLVYNTAGNNIGLTDAIITNVSVPVADELYYSMCFDAWGRKLVVVATSGFLPESNTNTGPPSFDNNDYIFQGGIPVSYTHLTLPTTPYV